MKERTYEINLRDYPNATCGVYEDSKTLALRTFYEMLEDKITEIEESKELKEEGYTSYTFEINVQISDWDDEEDDEE